MYQSWYYNLIATFTGKKYIKKGSTKAIHGYKVHINWSYFLDFVRFSLLPFPGGLQDFGKKLFSCQQDVSVVTMGILGG